jgi:L-lactate dehydrogenase complex protein LldG
MADRTEFLEAIRHRTRRGQYKPTKSPDSVWTPGVERPGREEIADPQARFIEELETLGGHGEQAESLQEARKYVLDLARERETKLLVRWDVEYLDELGTDEPLRESGVEVALWREAPHLRKTAGRADIGLSTAAWAIAETGSLVLEHGPKQGRSVTLLPPTYVAVLPADRVLRTVPDAVQKYVGNALPANVCFHTGPSRSGDIEMSLVVGMHGPGDVHVILVG